MRAGIVSEDDALRIPTKIPGMVRQGGAAGCFGFGASGSLRTFWGMDFGHFLVNHTEEKIEVGSVPSGPNVHVHGPSPTLRSGFARG